jgi:hypothetical protein
MTIFEKFGDYMFSLLFTPLRKGKQKVNQFYIFFKVIGKIFDDCKQDIFRVREESMIISASESMLLEHGRDRNMPMLKGEDIETYRTRLSMRAIIAEKAGTKEGILLAVKALGYQNPELIPLYQYDTTRWAEFLLVLPRDIDAATLPFDSLKRNVRQVKEASAKDNYRLIYHYAVQNEESIRIRLGLIIGVKWWSDVQALDGSFLLDGSTLLNSEGANLPIRITYKYPNGEEIVENI